MAEMHTGGAPGFYERLVALERTGSAFVLVTLVEARGSVRPFARAKSAVARGFRVHGFVDADHYLKNGPRRRADLGATFEHPRLNAGIEYLSTKDQPTATKPASGPRFTALRAEGNHNSSSSTAGTSSFAPWPNTATSREISSPQISAVIASGLLR